MKRNMTGMLALTLAFGFITAGCTTTYQYEKEAPIETQAKLTWMGKEIQAVALDEVGVSWKVKGLMGSFGTSVVYLPPGPRTLTVDYKSNLGTAYAIHVGANFIAGRTYTLIAKPSMSGLFSSSVTLEIIEQGSR